MEGNNGDGNGIYGIPIPPHPVPFVPLLPIFPTGEIFFPNRESGLPLLCMLLSAFATALRALPMLCMLCHCFACFCLCFACFRAVLHAFATALSAFATALHLLCVLCPCFACFAQALRAFARTWQSRQGTTAMLADKTLQRSVAAHAQRGGIGIDHRPCFRAYGRIERHALCV